MATRPVDADTTVDPIAANLDPEALDRLSGKIRSDIEASRYAAASILIARGDTIAYRDEIGEVAPGRTGQPDDVYLLMSLSKAFAATLVLRAIDHGRLTLDSRVAEILPQFGARGKQTVTVRQLLTHTAGTYAGFPPPPPLTVAQDVGDLAKNVAVISALPLSFTPGSQVVYNPFASYAVLGQLLVEIDDQGRSFAQIARDEIFDPLGMADTTYGFAVDDPRRVPVSVGQSDTGVTDKGMFEILNTAFTEHSEHPAGGAFGTTLDVYKFTQAMRGHGTRGDHRLMSAAMFDYACRIHTGDMRNGFWDFDRESNGIPEFPANLSLLGGYVRGTGHYLTPFGQTASPSTFGAVGGGSTFWMVDPERDLTFVFLSAGFLEGLDHFARLQQLSDLALAAVAD
ncbi:serine hydrolase domain-containing protein [Gordonia polyisoprenivorans]|uniref:serine hydrolase domain-containing protein n=1 Tax=Gordonia polyisoprenivorans TaxID=84595 RepID=UPI0023012E5C|nr:serine hydrolase domain-containing protein [Gordonia polyisoprenivorans]WCB36896.1 serine hydrolase [Gordonia polyisoprenivorans]